MPQEYDTLTLNALTHMWKRVVTLTHEPEEHGLGVPSARLVEELRLKAAEFHGAVMVLPSNSERKLASYLWYLVVMAEIDAKNLFIHGRLAD